VDLYLEGSDQHRGWFQLSLLPSLGVTGVSPFKNLLTHGFMVDRHGKKMSKSLGNALEVNELLGNYGADVCRWWVSSLAYENDIKVDLDYFEVAGESYRKVRNTLRFLLSNLDDFTSGDRVDEASLAPTSLDAWALAQGAQLRSRVVAAYLEFDFRRVHLLLYDFCNETLSAGYLNAMKDRLYCHPADHPQRRATQTVMWQLTELLAHLLAPILPHTADEALGALLGDGADSVHLGTFPALEAQADPRWVQVMELRDEGLRAIEEAKSRGIENPLDAGVTLPDPEGLLADFLGDLPELLGVSRVSLSPTTSTVEVTDLRQEPRCERSWRRDETVRLRSDGGWLSDRDAEAVGVS
jgi:isoleucyl-tRNA synthetase